jgi:hypothetical protein
MRGALVGRRVEPQHQARQCSGSDNTDAREDKREMCGVLTSSHIARVLVEMGLMGVGVLGWM